jgi:hypothetical protein
LYDAHLEQNAAVEAGFARLHDGKRVARALVKREPFDFSKFEASALGAIDDLLVLPADFRLSGRVTDDLDATARLLDESSSGMTERIARSA